MRVARPLKKCPVLAHGSFRVSICNSNAPHDVRSAFAGWNIIVNAIKRSSDAVHFRIRTVAPPGANVEFQAEDGQVLNLEPKPQLSHGKTQVKQAEGTSCMDFTS